MVWRSACVLLSVTMILIPAPVSAQDPAVADAARDAEAASALGIIGPPPPQPPAVVARDAEGRTTMRAVRVTGPMRVDGALDESLYSTPSMTDFVQVEPSQGAPATERTEIWFGFDRDNVYISFRCWDSQPERRVTRDMRRDGSAMFSGDDVIYLFLDTFYDRRNGMTITINSLGGRSDGQVTGEQYNGDWNPVYGWAVGKFDGGWTAEVALPFKSLRYGAGESQIWGFNAARTVRWRNEISVLVPVPPWRAVSAARQAQLAGTVVGIEAPSAAANVEIKPFVASSLTTNALATPRLSNDPSSNAGLDFKYSLTQNLIADFTVNTDFAQVEADEQQINLTRFNLFFPEKREFFLENQGTFAFGGAATGGSGSDTPILFYSRRIGLNAGLPVPIDVGGRLTGRAGRFSLGLLDIRTGDTPDVRSPATNFSVIRVKRDVMRRSSVGMLYTGRSVGVTGTGRNAVYGVDGIFNFYNYLSIASYWARTETPALQRNDDTSYRAHLDYNADRYGLQIGHLAVGSRFNPEVGFVRRSDIRRSNALFRFSPRFSARRVVRKLSWTGEAVYLENGAGRLDLRQQNGEFAIEFRNADRFALSYEGAYEYIPRPFAIATNRTVPVGGYDSAMFGVNYTTGPQRTVNGNVLVEHGTFYGGHRTALTVTRGRLSFGPRFFLEPSYTVNHADLPGGSFTTHLIGSRLTRTMTPRMFASALLQYNSGVGSMTANVRLRWEYRPGSELFIVYNDERDTRLSGFPRLSTRSLIFKVNRMMRF